MEGHQHHISANVDAGDRFPQWSVQETRDFLMIRAELHPTFMETKRNKLLWEAIATKMKDKGYNRSAEQCKCKWKNLVTRYKGCETMEPEGRQQFPYYNEMQAIFAARMQRMLWIEAEGGGASGSKKKGVALSSDDEDDNEESDREKGGGGTKKKRKVALKSASRGNIDSLKEVLEEFMKQQMQMEMEWINAYEAKEEERRMKEKEWRQAMEALEKERVMMDRKWREREEQKRMREEARAEKRDALLTALLNKLRRENHM